MVLNMLGKIVQILTLSLVLSPLAHANEGQFTLLPRGGIAPFEATCFNDVATAKLLTWKEFLAEELNKKCSYEKEKLILLQDLEYEKIQITLEETEVRYEAAAQAREEELETLRNLIKKNRKFNIPAIIVTSTAIGVAIGFGSYHAASN